MVLVGLVLECGRRNEKPRVVAAAAGQVVAESGHEERPLVVEPHHDGRPGGPGIVPHGGGIEIAGVVVGESYRREGAITRDVDDETVAIEQRRYLAANIGLECRLRAR